MARAVACLVVLVANLQTRIPSEGKYVKKAIGASLVVFAGCPSGKGPANLVSK